MHEQAGFDRQDRQGHWPVEGRPPPRRVDSLIDGITRSLKKGDSITFVGFGTFSTSQRKARTARNPQTGAAIKVPKRRVARFKAGKSLKDAVR